MRIAVALAADSAPLQALRNGLRPRMQVSPFCDVKAFTRGLEEALLALAQKVTAGAD